MSDAWRVASRSWWGWGYEEHRLSGRELAGLVGLVRERFGLSGEQRHPPRVEDLALQPPRLTPPGSLAAITTTAPRERAAHAQGKAYRDVVRALAGRIEHPPDVVLHPRNESDITAVLDWCTSVGAAAIPYGGGSSVVGGVEPAVGDGYRGAVTVDLSALDRVLGVDEVSLAARVQAGTLGPALEDQLRPYGLTLRHYPQSFECSSLGGWIATRSAGHFATGPTHIDDLVESVRAVTPAGVVETRRLPSSGAGPSPDGFLLGSEGVLGVVTEAWVRVRPRPRWRAGGPARFASFDQGVAASRALAQSGLQPANARLLDPVEALINGVGDGSGAVLLVGFESADHPMGPWATRASECIADHKGTVDPQTWQSGDEPRSEHTDGEAQDGDLAAGDTGDERTTWRRSFLRAPYVRDALVTMGVLCETLETAVTWERFEHLRAAVSQAATEMLAAWGARNAIVTCRLSHLYPDGPAPYFTVIAPARPGAELEQWDSVKAACSDAVLGAGGTITHHHAVGRDHRPWYDRQRPALFATALQAAKQALDPAAILNPGVLIEPARGPASG